MQQKSNPFKFFAVFSATAWNFNLQFYRFFLRKRSTSNCQAKYDSVEKRRHYRLLNMTAYRFFSIKMFKLKMLFHFQKPVTTLLPMTSQCRFIYFLYKFSLNYRSFKAIAGCPPDSSSNTHCAQRTELAAGQLSRCHHKKTNGLQIRRIQTQ